ncbi:MAG: amidinotransferase [Flavobacteriaceae bacterium]|nr:amidinotransferase [Flavobacteriaceae bacterium]
MNGLANHVLMVRPYFFKKNLQTASNNFYQSDTELNENKVNELAVKEFDMLVQSLEEVQIRVTVHQDNKTPDTPDSIFPNNWLSFHNNHQIILYPMFAPNRRKERLNNVFDTLKNNGINVKILLDLTKHEDEGKFLEGTGSMVLDRINKKAYSSLSKRTNKELVMNFCKKMDYEPVIFSAFQTVSNRRENIYHTNVMMSLGDNFAVVGLNSIDNLSERNLVIENLKNDNKEIIELSENQLDNFVGNMILLHNGNEPILLMSSNAFYSLTLFQKKKLSTYARIKHSPLNLIEKLGGGSARCMLAEIF